MLKSKTPKLMKQTGQWKRIVLELCGILVLIIGISAYIRSGNQNTQGVDTFTLAGGTPVYIKDGNVLEYQSDGNWKVTEKSGDTKQHRGRMSLRLPAVIM